MKYLVVDCAPRYWEDSLVSLEGSYIDIEDKDGDLIPCRNGDHVKRLSWNLMIDIDTGQILNWEIGKSARIHYKVCDAGVYVIFNDNFKECQYILWNYVPNILSIGGEGYGDYIIMRINKEGIIENFPQHFKNKYNCDDWHFQKLKNVDEPIILQSYNNLISFVREKKINQILD